MMSVIFFFETSGSEVFAANGSVKPKDGFISVEYQDLTEFRDGDKKIAPEAPKDYANYIFAGWYKDEDCKQAMEDLMSGNMEVSWKTDKNVSLDIVRIKHINKNNGI